MANTEKIIRHLVNEKVPFILLINKIDRLILELKLPPADAYFKIKYTIEEVNSVLTTCAPEMRMSPERGNVCFASSNMGWCFTLNSFAKMYAEKADESFDQDAFVRRLWGDIYFDEENRNFRKSPTETAKDRSFIHFILEPLYKLYATIISEDIPTVKQTLAELGIYLKPKQLTMDVKPLLSIICAHFFGNSDGLVSMCVAKIPSPLENAQNKIEHIYSGDMTSAYGAALRGCDPNGPLMVQIVKLYNADNVSTFDAFGRVMSGTLKVGQNVRVLGESYSPDDEEDMAVKEVSGLSIYESRYKVKVTQVPAGNWVLIAGVDQSIIKTATITDTNADDEVYTFRPLRFMTQPVLKIAVEPVNPTELPKMLEGLRKVNRSYPILTTKVEESGEHVILGPGELYLDSVMHDLRKLYSEIDIKVADPVVKFCETVVETSSIKCFAETPNKKNKITMICEPLEKGIAEGIEAGHIDIKWDSKTIGKYFVDKYEWDILSSRNIWAFGPDDMSPNILVNDTLPSEVYLTNSRLIRNYYIPSRTPSSKASSGDLEKAH
jgi:116 kDa U5 small nuclear ribonucleoprotein component